MDDEHDDPRASIVDGSHEAPLAIQARIDQMKGMRDYFQDMYTNTLLNINLRKESIGNLVSLSRRHISFYNEASQILCQCIEEGVIFDPKDIRKLQEYHLERSSLIASILESRKKEEAENIPAPSMATAQ